MQRPDAASVLLTVQAALAEATRTLQRAGVEDAGNDARRLLAASLALSSAQLLASPEARLGGEQADVFARYVARRAAREPVSRILGEREFYGRPFRVDARVLVPRPDTETLVETALKRTLNRSLYGRALDLCTGSGCVATSFALERRTWRVTGLDVSEAAARLARENAERLGAAFSTRWLVGDLYEPLAAGERFELITANPPYIPHADIATLDADVRDFEPHLALDGGADGLALLRRVIQHAPDYLAPAGILALEVGHDQASRVSELLEARGFQAIESARDYGRIERVVSGCYGPP